MKIQNIDFALMDITTLEPKEDTLYQINFHNWQDKKTILVQLKDPHVKCRIDCRYTVAQGAKFDLELIVKHGAPHTYCAVTIRGVLYQKGESYFFSKIFVDKLAVGSISQLEDRLLTLGESVCSHARPFMQIETNDVTASHKTSTGRPDESQIFYLQSRGMSYEQACETLVQAFLKV